MANIRENAKKWGGLLAMVTAAGAAAKFGLQTVSGHVRDSSVYRFASDMVSPVVDGIRDFSGINLAIPVPEYATAGTLAIVGAKAGKGVYDSIIR
jgi:hypothetical protein